MNKVSFMCTTDVHMYNIMCTTDVHTYVYYYVYNIRTYLRTYLYYTVSFHSCGSALSMYLRTYVLRIHSEQI